MPAVASSAKKAMIANTSTNVPMISVIRLLTGLRIAGAVRVGLLVFAIGLSLGGTTGYAINPARDLGPRIMHAILPIAGKGPSDWAYSWIPVVGPIIGGILAAVAFGAFYP